MQMPKLEQFTSECLTGISFPESAYILFCIWWQGSEGSTQAPKESIQRDHTGQTGLSSVGVVMIVGIFLFFFFHLI